MNDMHSYDFNDLLSDYQELIPGNPFISRILRLWESKNRYYHNLSHLVKLTKRIKKEYRGNEKLLLAALFHDVIYDPRSDTNEADSVKVMMDQVPVWVTDRQELASLIMATKGDNFTFTSDLQKQFVDLDREILFSDPSVSFKELIEYEIGIEKEYQFVSWNVYSQKRIEFLNHFASKEPRAKLACDFLRGYISGKRPTIGVFAGSTNPLHLGHLSIIRQAERMFDKVIVAVGSNPEKIQPGAKLPQETVAELLKYHQVESYSGFLTVFLKELEQKDNCVPILIRGIRNDTDFKYEHVQLRVMRDINPDIRVVFIPSESDVEHISSSLIKNVSKFDNENADSLTKSQVKRLLDLYNVTTESAYDIPKIPPPFIER